MAKTVVAVYDRREQAERAIQDLTNSGYDRDNISMVARDTRKTGERERKVEHEEGTKADEGAATGAGIGAVVGGIAGLLVEAGLLVIPGVGPVVAFGELAAILTGAAAGAGVGGLVGALIGMGIPEEEAHYYTEAVRRGGYLVAVKVAEERASAVTSILQKHNPMDIRRRAAEWRAEGWTPERTTTETKAERRSAAAAATTERTRDTTERTHAEKEAEIEVVEEDLKVGKREVERGGVRVEKEVHEEPVEEKVRVRDENIEVERERVDRPATDEDMEAWRDKTIEMTETDEEVVVEKEPRVVEEIRLEKEAEERTETVRDTVRKTEVDIEHVGMGDGDGVVYTEVEPIYREHYQSHYANKGDGWETYQPAYRYGYELGSRDRYRGRRWEEIEPEAHREWDRENKGTWERFREPIRQGWYRVQSEYQRRRT